MHRCLVAFVLLLLVSCDGGTQREPDPLQDRLDVGAILRADVQDARGFASADAVRKFRFPADHGPHPAFRSEWWYLTFVLDDADGERYGVQFTAFRQAIVPPAEVAGDSAWRTPQIYMAHLAVSDVARRRHHDFERYGRGRPELAGASADPLAVWVDGWSLRATDAATNAASAAALDVALPPLRLDAAAGAIGVQLHVEAVRPIVLQGEQGLSRKGPGQASYYYSVPRLEAHGTLEIDGREHAVTGLGWLDREWSTSALAPEQAGWDWFGLHLDDGSDLMLYRLRREDGAPSAFDSGVHVAADGTYQILAPADFELEPLEHWSDGGTQWPIRWRLSLAGRAEPLVVEAAFPDQRMDTSVRYWEGVAFVADAAGNVVGRGYMELTGY